VLDPSADEIRDWGQSVTKLIADYHGSIRDRGGYLTNVGTAAAK
jgi:hypothetical protein